MNFAETMTAADVIAVIEWALMQDRPEPPRVTGATITMETRVDLHGVPWHVLDESIARLDGLDWVMRFNHDERTGTCQRTAGLRSDSCHVTLYTVRVPVAAAALAGVA